MAIRLAILFGYLLMLAATKAGETLTLFGSSIERGYGECVAGVGDFDGDGFHDFAVSFPIRGADKAHVDVFRGGEDIRLDAASVLVRPGGTLGFGSAVAPVGDVNGDGFGDIVAGAPRGQSQNRVAEGHLLFFSGTRSLGSMAPKWSLHSRKPKAQLGHSLSGGRNVLGDGRVELVAGLPGWGNDLHGAIWILTPSIGSTNGPVWSKVGERKGGRLGTSVCLTGDADGDGRSDVAAGAPGVMGGDGQTELPGEVLVFRGADTPTTEPAWRVGAPPGERFFGQSVAWVDLDGDGRSELAVGAPGDRISPDSKGGVFVYSLTAGRPPQLLWWWQPKVAGSQAGWCAANAGDTNGDGCEDLVVSLPEMHFNDGLHGQVVVFLGRKGATPNEPDLVIDGPAAGAPYGHCVAGIGDINRDGVADFAIGSPLVPGPRNVGGRVDIIFGSKTHRAVHIAAHLDGGFHEVMTGLAVKSAPSAMIMVVDKKRVPWGKYAAWLGGVLFLIGVIASVVHRSRIRTAAAFARDETRGAMRKDLHDDAEELMRQAEIVVSQIAESGHPQGRKALQWITEATRAVRDTVYREYHESCRLDKFASEAADLMENGAANAGIRFECVINWESMPRVEVTGSWRKEMTSVAREITTNMTRHSGARLFRVKFDVTESRLRMTASDNGQGFDTASASGEGLRNMRARVKMLSGTISIESSSAGTVIDIDVPVG